MDRTIEDELSIDIVVAVIDQIRMNIVEAERQMVLSSGPEQILSSIDGICSDIQAFACSAGPCECTIHLNKNIVRDWSCDINSYRFWSDEIFSGVTSYEISSAVNAERIHEARIDSVSMPKRKILSVIIQRGIRSKQ